MNVFTGTTASVWFDFKQPSGMLVPDEGSVKFSLLEPSTGLVITDQVLDIDAGATGVNVIISSQYNSLPVDKEFESRIIIINWTVNTSGYQAIKRYRIVPFPLYTAEPDHVRGFLGIDEDELPDEEVDIFAAYLKLRSSVNEAMLDAALMSGDIAEINANKAIVLTAVLELIPSLRLRVLNSISQGDDRYSRFRDTPNFDALQLAAETKLAELTQTLVVTASSTSIFVILSTPTDPITGG